MAATIRCDVAIAGAGLAGSLLALALAARHPALDVRLIDSDHRIGGDHVWSFFGSDIADADRWLLTPLIGHAWRDYDVAFPAHRRTIAATYYSIESARLDQVVRQALPERALLLDRKVLATSTTAVVFADGDRIEAKGVIDARGAGDVSALDLGWQKFVGRLLRVPGGHDVARPMVMDATVSQIDGYRFLYCLPFDAERVFVEDTYYSESPTLNVRSVARRIDAYAAQRDWQGVEDAGHQERGVLPVAMGGDFETYWKAGGARVAKVGMRAGLFHPTTGYSLPDAVRSATAIAAQTDFSGLGLHGLTHDLARTSWDGRNFYRLLDRMLFRAAEPEERYRVLERFYRLDPRLIGRFYAGHSTMSDKARVLVGKPPVPIGRAIRALAGGGRA
jgi:lycopene beta-cyclase